MTTIKNLILVIFTSIVIIAAGLMALLIGLILPRKFHTEDYDYFFVGDMRSAPTGNLSHVNRYIEQRNKWRRYGDISKFSWIVSLSIPRYNDDSFAKFVCTGAVISENEILTGSDCISEPLTEEDFYKGTVRSLSEYFWVGGMEHRVVKYLTSRELPSPYDGLYILRVAPAFSRKVKTLSFISGDLNWTIAVEAGWGGDRVSKLNIRKFDPFHYQRWFREEEKCCKKLERCEFGVKSSDEECTLRAVITGNLGTSRINGRPLVTTEGDQAFMIGVKLNGKPETDFTFLDLSNVKFLHWIRNETSVKVKGKPHTEAFVEYVYSKFAVTSYVKGKIYES